MSVGICMWLNLPASDHYNGISFEFSTSSATAFRLVEPTLLFCHIQLKLPTVISVGTGWRKTGENFRCRPCKRFVHVCRHNGVWLRDPLKPLSTILSWYTGGFRASPKLGPGWLKVVVSRMVLRLTLESLWKNRRANRLASLGIMGSQLTPV